LEHLRAGAHREIRSDQSLGLIIGPVIGGGLADATGSFTSALAVSVLVLVSAGALTFRGLKFFRVKGESKIAWSSEG
jgi:cyanate permease